MNALLAFLLSVGASLLSYALIAIWYVVPRLSKRPRVEALLPLVLLHMFRTVGLVFLFPQVTGGALPPSFAAPAAYGTAVLPPWCCLAPPDRVRAAPAGEPCHRFLVPAACCAIHPGRERERSFLEWYGAGIVECDKRDPRGERRVL